jgi:hypothetical protein
MHHTNFNDYAFGVVISMLVLALAGIMLMLVNTSYVSQRSTSFEAIRETVNDFGYQNFEIIGKTPIEGGYVVYVRGLDVAYRLDLLELVCNDNRDACVFSSITQTRLNQYQPRINYLSER